MPQLLVLTRKRLSAGQKTGDLSKETRERSAHLSGGQAVQLTAVYLPVPEGYVAFVEELPGANTQGATLDEARENLQEAIQLVLEANRALAEESLDGKEAI